MKLITGKKEDPFIEELFFICLCGLLTGILLGLLF